jgi:peroxiredoxin
VIVIGACVVVVGSFCVLNFLLTLGVIRKLRQHERALMRSPAPEEWIMPNDWRLAVGAPVPDFTATAITGETVSRADLTDKRAVIAFFSTDCESCRTQLNRFANHARKRSSEGWRVVAVVNGDLATAPEFVSALQGVVTTVVEPDQGPVSTAFSTVVFPTIYVVGTDGIIQACVGSVKHLENMETTNDERESAKEHSEWRSADRSGDLV